ncbi:PH domain-containing protein [Clostridium arbusti]|uniref:PH domain-containing protein n=1 Tax=Clostridium arbusti TaxID=1137848 RepID=UPI000288C8B7|nr:PH domain-containing protein [Clostridium arbusti]
MEWFKPLDRKKGSQFIIIITILCDIFIVLGSIYLNDYLLDIFLRTFLLVFNIYQIYNIALFLTLRYSMDNEAFYIITLFGLRKSKLLFKEMEAYTKSQGIINAVRLSGYGKKNFAIGKCFFKKLGFVNMYVTSNKNVFYLKDNDEVYGVSPEDSKIFEDRLIHMGIGMGEWSPEKTKPVRLYKDNHFNIPLILSIVIIVFFTLRPLILYYKGLLPSSMALSFNIKFQPTIIGTSRDFLFKQMSYSAFNAAILLCMYFAANFSAKHHKKTSYKYLYISLGIAVIFLLIQQRIISKVI